MTNFKNNPNAVAIRSIFMECPELKEYFNMDEYIAERVFIANDELCERLKNGEQYGPNLREEILEQTVLYDLKRKKAEIEQYA